MVSLPKREYIVPTWGFTSSLGWLLTIAMGYVGFYTTEILVMWTVLMGIPVAFTLLLWRDSRSNKLLNFWALVVPSLLVVNFLTPYNLSLYSYFHLWIISGTAGLYYTAKKVPSPYNKVYKYGVYASLAAIPLVFYRPYLTPVPAAIVQGGPMLYDYFRN